MDERAALPWRPLNPAASYPRADGSGYYGGLGDGRAAGGDGGGYDGGLRDGGTDDADPSGSCWPERHVSLPS